MSNCTNCHDCQGEKVSSKCVQWEGVNLPFESFEKIIEYIYVSVKKESNLDIKTLSEKSKVSSEEALQILIDAEVKRKYQSGTSNNTSSEICSSLNVSSLDNCNTCSKTLCEKLELMVSEISKLKLEVEQLKSQL
jgi:hypothetical protein